MATASPVPAHLTTALADRYTIERELGAGGMATVYLAHDLKHDRHVALKVLKPELAAVIGGERFVIEIRTTAALQHPHILPLFDSGTADGFLYYVMPFIDGETLRSKLDRETQLGIDEAVRITVAVADALDYAHRQGIIHRDIKPENILLHDGRPMVADFGIALALSAAAGGRMTETGMSLGTPHYMSPEQATADKEITGRSDIYSLASVLYEMLTGNPPHTGSSAQQIIMKIVTEDAAPVVKLRKAVPPHVAAAVAHALEKLPADRFDSARAFIDALNNPGFATAMPGTGPAAATRPGRWRLAALVGGGLAAAFCVLALWGWLRPGPPPPPAVRYSMGLPPEQAMRQGLLGVNLAISPDGRRMVYVGPGEGGDILWVRERDRLDATPLPGTTEGYSPFFSPDGSRIAFSSGQNTQLKVVPVSGGPPVTLASPGAGSGGGGAWSTDGWIYFDHSTGMHRVPAGGGAVERVMAYDSAAGEIGHAWPDALPNGKGVLYRSRRSLDPTDFDIMALDLETGTRHRLTKGLLARYVAPGYLVYVRADGAVLAAPFDQDRLQITGAEVPLFDGVMSKPFGSADFAISPAGTLMYVPGRASTAGGVAEIVYVDRAGTVEPLSPPVSINPSANRGLSLSPDGTRLALDVVGVASPDIWIKQLPNGPLSRLTFEGRGSYRPRWTPDGQSVLYVVTPDSGPTEVWRKRADGSTPAELVWRMNGQGIFEAELSGDGQWLVWRGGTAGNRDIFAARPGRDTAATPLLTGGFQEEGPTLSPDGRWLAYSSNESGQYEIYVRPFPGTNGGRWQVSTRGGIAALWSRNGRELYFESGAGELMSVTVTPGTTFAPGEARAVIPRGGAIFASAVVPYYAITPDDRFITMRLAAVNQAPGAGQVIVVENWLGELRAKMVTGR